MRHRHDRYHTLPLRRSVALVSVLPARYDTLLIRRWRNAFYQTVFLSLALKPWGGGVGGWGKTLVLFLYSTCNVALCMHVCCARDGTQSASAMHAYCKCCTCMTRVARALHVHCTCNTRAARAMHVRNTSIPRALHAPCPCNAWGREGARKAKAWREEEQGYALDKRGQ